MNARATPIPGADADWLAAAVDLAEQNVDAGGGPFGALVVRGGVTIGRSGNRVTDTLDPTAHAEVMAIREACRRLGDHRLTGATLYSSCEPCPMCLAAALWARVDRIVYAADRHDAAAAGFDDLAFHELFETPRRHWRMSTTQIPCVVADRPFAAWSRAVDRVDY